MAADLSSWLFYVPGLAFMAWISFTALREILPASVSRIRHAYRSRRYHRKILESLPVDGVPRFYLDKPELATAAWGNAAFDAWVRVTEPRFRDHRGYPPDWRWRRLAVLKRDGNRCTRCGTASAELHAHHRKRVAEGGSHGLENLLTLWRTCHSVEHPSNALLLMGRRPHRPLFSRRTSKNFPSDEKPGGPFGSSQ